MAGQAQTYTINPHKFIIFDSEVSDVESDSEEWVSISTSATTGTLPNQIVLRPRAHNIPAAPKPKQTAPNSERQAPSQLPRNTDYRLSMLQMHLPTLKAIYIVNPTSITPRLNHNMTYGPFSSFWLLKSAPVGLHIPSAKESYLRVCGDCVRGRIVLFCDGTWKAAGPDVCERHVGIARKGDETIVRSGNAGQREIDSVLFEAIVALIQPNLSARIEMAGIRVFDMIGETSEKGFVHREGCGCAENWNMEA